MIDWKLDSWRKLPIKQVPEYNDLAKVNSFMANKEHPGLSLQEGHFGFAGHNDPVAFRNIRIKELY